MKDKPFEKVLAMGLIALIIVLFSMLVHKQAHAQPDPQDVWDVELNSTLTFKPGSGSMDDSLENRSWQGPVDKVIYNDTLITFIDGADLQRQYREIASVCDTVWADTSEGQFGFATDSTSQYGVGLTNTYNGTHKGLYRQMTVTNLENDKIETRYFPPIIRCRTNVRIAIVPEYWLDRSVTAEYSPPKEPQALICWEWTE